MSWDLAMIDLTKLPKGAVLQGGNDEPFIIHVPDTPEGEYNEDLEDAVYKLHQYGRHKYWSEGTMLLNLILKAVPGANPTGGMLNGISWTDTDKELDLILSERFMVGSSNDPYVFHLKDIKYVYDFLSKAGTIDQLDELPKSQYRNSYRNIDETGATVELYQQIKMSDEEKRKLKSVRLKREEWADNDLLTWKELMELAIKENLSWVNE